MWRVREEEEEGGFGGCTSQRGAFGWCIIMEQLRCLEAATIVSLPPKVPSLESISTKIRIT